MVWRGLKFGMLLQLAIGPMCLMVFKTSATQGVLYGLCLLAAIALVDAIYIALSCTGVVVVLYQAHVKMSMRILGALVLAYFGANMVAEGLGFSLLPQLALFSKPTGQSLFVQGLFLTASNPLTILFWCGVLSLQVTEHSWNKKELFLFSLGCILATLLFLTGVAFLAGVCGCFLPRIAIQILNVLVGIAIIIFGTRLLLKTKK